MENHVYKVIELTGTSAKGIEDAVNTALERAGRTIKNLRWFEVVDIRGEIDQDKVERWQVSIKVGFTIVGQEAEAGIKALAAKESEPGAEFRVLEPKKTRTATILPEALTAG